MLVFQTGEKVYRLVISTGLIILIDACASDYDTILWLFNTTETGYYQVASNDDSTCGLRSRIELYLSPVRKILTIDSFLTFLTRKGFHTHWL
jgi:hypothetical protein